MKVNHIIYWKVMEKGKIAEQGRRNQDCWRVCNIQEGDQGRPHGAEGKA